MRDDTSVTVSVFGELAVLKFVLCIALVMMVTAAAAKGSRSKLVIGGYYLGMTNAQAAKIGLSNCTQKYSYSDIYCEPVLPHLPGETKAHIRLSAKTHEMVEFRVQVFSSEVASETSLRNSWTPDRWWQEANTLASAVQTSLAVRCTSRYTETERLSRVVSDSCYLGHVTQLVRRGYNEVYESGNVRNTGNKPHAQVLLTLKRDGGEKLYLIKRRMASERAKAETRMSDFAVGK